MEIKLEVPDYGEDGFIYKWEPDSEIEVKFQDNVVIVIANSSGLKSLANHLLNLAQENVPQYYYFNLDEYNSLEKGSIELIVQKK
ncbi:MULTISPECIES: Imm32 family immunity protein [Parachlamydia]|uniref:Uncharacterized protein n=2 Tax=Parachlamydia acanthamoebae TaxID=83552 RepID=F8L186_PARAV|nr:hypothetical protein [Parachlamydia acanthamoebae]EFB40738.1 hypothetical protein pah_c196o002 [Parachlamydia acanthamoebae str. Hall's coccus]KIA77290.1 hypothetical protein DB43_GO00020 [Parachlamydia acanthamoebae]CCB87010.1 putative uncharacterized protein [Parachlamydia acanthamoebae UV-7]